MVLFAAVLAAWTNTAGRVLLAEPVRIEGASVVMRCGPRGTRTLPLSVFPSGEQARIRAALGRFVLPPALAELRTALAADLARAEQRHAGGVLPDGNFAAKRARIRAAWARALEDAKLTRAEVDYWKGNLK